MMQPLQVSKRVMGMMVCMICVFLANTSLWAQTPTYAFDAGAINNAFPLSSSTGTMVQWLYTPADFSPTVPSGNITTIYVKPASNATNATFTNLTVRMGHTTLTSMVSGPWITGLTTVFTATSHVFPTATNGSWLALTLQTPFPYTAGSNLIIEMSQGGYLRGFGLLQDNSYSAARLYGTPAGSGTSASGKVRMGFDVAPANCSGTPNAGLITTAPMTRPVCNVPVTIEASSNNTSTAGLSYQWERAAALAGPYTNVTGGTGATTLTYTSPPVTANTWFRLKTTCSGSSLSVTSLPYAVTVAADSIPPITGDSLYCPGGRNVYRIPPVPGATSYNWTLPTGWTGTSNTDSIVATAGANAGSISLTVTGICGTSAPRSFAVVRGTAPAAAGSITGNTTVCSGATQTYSIAAVPDATFYTWTLPPGWTGTSTTSSISVTPGTTGGTISVSADNLCGASTPSTLAVAISNQPSAAGVISGRTSVCAAATETYTVSPIPGALSYNWTLPSGWSGTSSTSSITVTTGTASGDIQVRGNNGCGNGVAAVYPVTVLPTLAPSVTIASTDTTICAGVPVTFTPTSVNGGITPAYEWLVNGIARATGPAFTTSTLATGSSVSVRLNSNYQCPSTPSVLSNSIVIIVRPAAVPGINVNMNSGTTICEGSSVTFTTNITHGGATPSFQWKRNGLNTGTNAPTYMTNQLTNNDSIYCVMTSSDECAINPQVTSNRTKVEVRPNVVPSVSVSANPGTTIADGQWVTFTASGTNGGSTPGYQWTRNGTDIPGATAATYSTNTLRSGDHIRVKMTSADVCASPAMVWSGNLVINGATSVGNTLPGIEGFGLAPNPNTGKFILNGEWAAHMYGKEATITVLNMLGQVIYSRTAEITSGSWKADINLDAQASGMYLLQLTADGQKGIKRFEIRK